MNTPKQRGAFVSYSRKDKEFALEFAGELKSAGYSVWLDQLDIPAGARWDDEVEKALHEYEIFLIILTPASVSSENVKDEIGYAIDHGKHIMPVLLEECVIPLRLRRFQYVDFTKMEFNEGIKRAKQLLESLLKEQSTPTIKTKLDPAPQKVPSRETQQASALPGKNKSAQRRWVGLGVGLFALIICVGVLGGVAILFRNVILPSAPTELPVSISLTQPPTEPPIIEIPPTQPPTEPPIEILPTEPPSSSPSTIWTMDSTGACRDIAGGYPRWSEYNWSLPQCKEACQNNPNCQGFVMSKEKDYCQLFGSDGQYDGSGTSTQITRGDSNYPIYTCFIKR